MSFKSMCTALLMVVFSTLSAQADNHLFVPALYDVSGVASNDTLNIRTEASTSGGIIGEFAHNTLNIEVVALNNNGTWGLVNIEGQSGWTSMRYLRRQGDQPPAFPLDGLTCTGTEPFWSLSFGGGNRAFGDWTPFDPAFSAPRAYNNVWAAPPLARPGTTFGFWMEDSLSTVSGAMEAELCSDGMSDRSYGWSVIVLLQNAGGNVMISGCCSVGGF